MRALFVVLMLAGCAATSAPPESTCNAAHWQALVGQPEEAIYGALANLRVVRTGEPVTDDLNPNRLNAKIGRDGNIIRFGCY